jgi:hypothetical protein
MVGKRRERPAMIKMGIRRVERENGDSSSP